MNLSKNNKIYIAIGVVAIVAIAIVANTLLNGGNQRFIAYDNMQVNASQVSQLEAIAGNQTLAQKIGLGAALGVSMKANGTHFYANGKPAVLYIGAEYCPYCAATRWSLMLALMRFGKFSNLHYMTSSASDVYAITPTFTFYNSTYQSDYLSFIPIEEITNTYQQLQSPNATEERYFEKYQPGGGYPFIDFANKMIEPGSIVNPGLIHQYSWDQIITQLSNPNTSIAQEYIGGADVFTADICYADNFTPSSVCDAPYVARIINQSG